MYDIPASGDGWLRQASGAQDKAVESAKQLRSLIRDKGPGFGLGSPTFFSPLNIAEFAGLLSTYPDVTILAGGTDVGLWVTKQQRDLPLVIYTGRVAELQQLEVTDSHIEIGAAVTISDAMPIIVEHYPELDELLRRFASPPIRNAGTLGGNIANGSQIGDSMAALMVVGTTLTLCAGSEMREVALDNFYIDYMINDLQPGEFISTIRIPLPEPGTVLRSYKLSKRFDQDISAVCTAYRLELDGDNVASIRVACGGLAATVKRAKKCEAAIIGKRWDENTIREGAAALANDFKPLDDMRASAKYRMRASQNLLQRFYLETSGELSVSVYTYGR